MVQHSDRMGRRIGADERAVQVFVRSGVVWQLCTDAYWLLLFVRVVTDLRLHPAQLLLLGTAKEVSILVSEVPTGIVADVVSRKRSVVIAFAMSGAGMILAGLAPGFWMMVIAQLVWGCGSTFRSGAETAWITDELGHGTERSADLGPILVRRSQWSMIASIAGILAAGLCSIAFSLGVSLVITGALMTVWAGVLVRAMPEHHFTSVPGEGRQRYLTPWREARRIVRGAPSLRWQLTAIVVAGCASEAVDRLYVRRFVEIGLPTRVPEVVLIGAFGIAEAAAGVFLVRTVRARLSGPTTALATAALLAITAVGVITIGVAPALAAGAVGFVLQGGVRAATSTAQTLWTNSFAEPASRATVHSFAGQAQSLGEISGGAVFGLITSMSTLTAAFTGSAVLYLAAATCSLIGARRWKATPG